MRILIEKKKDPYEYAPERLIFSMNACMCMHRNFYAD